ncbi:Y-family DNA polymerase [Bacillus niameyensis]|uniref:Y-family DNA polymerase n=1 Tax=Bacillus niameyensis TaxID=1522308 RepID=UPI0007853675|nr:UV damage repair protein UvrX [Bacillus niameyensis]
MDIDYGTLPHKKILCIDMKSFYASCSAVMKGLDPLKCHLAVIGNLSQPGSIVLAATPPMKKDFGIKTGSRLFEIPNDSRIILDEAKMSTYLRISTEIIRLFNRYVPKDAIHVYSVDESFIQIDGTSELWGEAHTVAKKIKDELLREFQLTCAIGIGPNMLLSKLCLDLDAKHDGIVEWTYEDVPQKLWKVSPLRKMWGIGKRLEKSLNNMGIFTVKQLAHYDRSLLEKKFGIMGNQLYYHAWGVDLSELGAPIMEGQISFGKSQILLRDYKERSEIHCVMLEMCEEVARRAREQKKAGRTISLGISYSEREWGGGFLRSCSIEEPTNTTMDIYRVCLKLFNTYDTGQAVRQISITLANIANDDHFQLSLFEPEKVREKELGYTVDHIRRTYGTASLLRAVSYTDAGTTRKRSVLVGGHKA